MRNIDDIIKMKAKICVKTTNSDYEAGEAIGWIDALDWCMTDNPEDNTVYSDT